MVIGFQHNIMDIDDSGVRRFTKYNYSYFIYLFFFTNIYKYYKKEIEIYKIFKFLLFLVNTVNKRATSMVTII